MVNFLTIYMLLCQMSSCFIYLDKNYTMFSHFMHKNQLRFSTSQQLFSILIILSTCLVKRTCYILMLDNVMSIYAHKLCHGLLTSNHRIGTYIQVAQVGKPSDTKVFYVPQSTSTLRGFTPQKIPGYQGILQRLGRWGHQ